MTEIFSKNNYKEYILLCSYILNYPQNTNERLVNIEYLYKTNFNNLEVLQNNSNKDFEEIIEKYGLKNSCELAKDLLIPMQFYIKKFNKYYGYQLTIMLVNKIFKDNNIKNIQNDLDKNVNKAFYLFVLVCNYELFLRFIQDKKFAKSIIKNKIFNAEELTLINKTIKLYINCPIYIQRQRFILMNSKKTRRKLHA
ncbi:hypothetical protein [Campylobacter sp. RM12651]|uniref:hypothetical protein n=1 Tax=Campylobacter sp. RM12651 TaxID=1660079 RepID=UPI001EFBF927|nr:hypothetical protein [Campylobacter sp. RM12651]ULO03832.1 hypothetical protein AVBRAN_1378 [Campylobacter sp. RM12651]